MALKKTLAVLLALMMILGLGIPAMAEDENASIIESQEELVIEPEESFEPPAPVENWWDGIEVILHPQETLIIQPNENITLEVELRGTEDLPEGWKVSAYEWVVYYSRGSAGSYKFPTKEPILHVSPGNMGYPRFARAKWSVSADYWCTVVIELESGEQKSFRVQRVVKLERDIWYIIRHDPFTGIIWGLAVLLDLFLVIPFIPFMILSFPLSIFRWLVS